MPIHIRGATEHNLQGIDVTIGDGLTVVTGVSGSGKTSLAFDTLYHEARRRYLEIFSLGVAGERLAPAQVQEISGLGPAVGVGQNLLNRNPHSTLATASGLHPFLRYLYSRFGARHCAVCGAGVTVYSEDEVIDRISALVQHAPVTVAALMVINSRGSHQTLLRLLIDQFGPQAVHVDGLPWADLQPGAERPRLDPQQPHHIAVEVAHVDVGAQPTILRAAMQRAAALGASAVILKPHLSESSQLPERFDTDRVTLAVAPICTACGQWFGGLEPADFHRVCAHCQGAGCAQCGASGLPPQAAAVRWQGIRLPDLLARSVSDVHSLFVRAALPNSAARLQDEIQRRLEALDAVGLGYISLDRSAPTLSRGEAQRVRLAVTLISRLEDMLHVLDEPTIGLHPADVARLLPNLRRLPGPVVCVEHDRAAAAGADQIIDLGPGAGRSGGQLVYSGAPDGLWAADSATGRYFSLRARVQMPDPRPTPDQFLHIQGAHARNLDHIDVRIPLARLTVITGVSGSGKSTLVEEVLVASLQSGEVQGCLAIEPGPDHSGLKPVLVNQDPIGRNPRSNPATYTKLADILRAGFAAATGLSPSHFSFNRPEGACAVCRGMGATEVKMRYLPSTWIRCTACDGARFSEQTLAARVDVGGRAVSMADLLELPVDFALELLADADWLPAAKRRNAVRILQALSDVGLGYLPLGQPSTTLSGGEAQRVKLARTLSRRTLRGQLLVLDEPSTGLHAQDVGGLLTVLDRLVRGGATVVVVEHNLDMIRAADWIVDLGPGAGPSGGQLLYAGPPAGLAGMVGSATGEALGTEAEVTPRTESEMAADHRAQATRPSTISIRGASVHNLQRVTVDFPKGKLTVVTGVSGSGKSSLVHNVLGAEAQRRFLETLSLYERQSTREGPEAAVETVTGLGVAVNLGQDQSRFNRRASVGNATEISQHLAVLLAWCGERRCLNCDASMARASAGASDAGHTREHWRCPVCRETAAIAQPRHFLPSSYAAACQQCHGVGTLQVPNPDKLIIHPERPLCDGAMHSPGFFPKGFLCKPFNSGYDLVQALSARYGFDPIQTPWQEMPSAAQEAFLFGDPEPMPVIYRNRKGRVRRRDDPFPGFFGWIRDWDVGGAYTDTQPCPACAGARLRPEYLAVTLAGHSLFQLSEMPLAQLDALMQEVVVPDRYAALVAANLATIGKRLHFLRRVGLGYLHLNRIATTLSAGEAQRIKLAGLLGSGLTALTILLDEPSRGLHPGEIAALIDVLHALRKEGNTVIVVEHDLDLIAAADHIVDLGPGAGRQGGKIMAQGSPQAVASAGTATGRWLHKLFASPAGRRESVPKAAVEASPRAEARSDAPRWLTIRGARAHNLRGETIRLPLGKLVGICGVSGSGKSTLLVDTLGRALAPKKQTSSVAREPIEPGAHDAIEGAPQRVIVLDQARAGVTNAADFLGISAKLRARYAESDDAAALDLDARALQRNCSACHGRGQFRTDMGFLPDIYAPCETCRGSGYQPEVWQVHLYGYTLPALMRLTINQVDELFQTQADDTLAQPLAMARAVGLGYLVLQQPGHALSGGEAQRLKIARELCRTTTSQTLYLLDEPTVGQHLDDITRLIGVLQRLVDAGHSVFVNEHQPYLLAACDWLVELGPGGGPAGGHVVAEGPPQVVAQGDTPTAPYLRAVESAFRRVDA